MVEIIVALILFASFIGFFMESYKKGLRDDKAGVWEIRVVAILMSFFYGFITWTFTDINTLPIALKFTPILILPYTVIIYILQKPACMKVWKPLLKKFIEGRR